MNIFAFIIFIAAIVALVRFFRPRPEDHQQTPNHQHTSDRQQAPNRQQASSKKQPRVIVTKHDDTDDDDIVVKPSLVEARIWAKEDAADEADGMVLKMPSYSKRGAVYTCNLRRVRCSCQDWLKRRNNGNDQHPARICKHLAGAYTEYRDKLPEALQPWRAIIDTQGQTGMGMPYDRRDYGEFEGAAYIVDTRNFARSGWVNLYFEGNFYGWNREERRWSYNKGPSPRSLWVKILRKELEKRGL